MNIRGVSKNGDLRVKARINILYTPMIYVTCNRPKKLIKKSKKIEFLPLFFLSDHADEKNYSLERFVIIEWVLNQIFFEGVF